MPVKPWTEQERRERVRAAMEAMEPPTLPDTVNAHEAAEADDTVVFAYRGRAFILPPIPVKPGIQLHKIRVDIERAHLEGAPDTEYLALHENAIRLMGRLARRRGWRGRLRRILPNPFRHASEKEVVVLLDFFWKYRTGIPFRTWLVRLVRQSTGSTRATNSRRPTTASQHRGGISSTG